MSEPGRKWSPVPREHGAWGMLAQPFLGALVVAGASGSVVHWLPAIPAALAAAVVFLMREPLLVLARQKWVWTTPRPETPEARKWVWIEALILAGAGAWLAFVWPIWLLLALGAGAAFLTLLAVYITIKNRQRAIWFQAASAAGLSASGLAACLATIGRVPAWGWWWWGLHAGHFLAGILVVHVRLEARKTARRGAMSAEFFKARRDTAVVEAVLGAAGVAMLAGGWLWFGAAALASVAWHLFNLYTAHKPDSVAMPMTSVGKRALAASLVFTVLVGVGAWAL